MIPRVKSGSKFPSRVKIYGKQENNESDQFY